MLSMAPRPEDYVCVAVAQLMEGFANGLCSRGARRAIGMAFAAHLEVVA
jgi:hypothetical protein